MAETEPHARAIGVIGVPTSAGAFAPGQEQAPAALRGAGLLDEVRAAGLEVHDHGDREPWRWRPDRGRPRAQNIPQVIEIVSDTARRVREAADAGQTALVLGGDCTVGIGMVAAYATAAEPPGLAYFDAHADLNVPDSVREGALDWMGLAHMLGEEGSVPELAATGPRTPLLAPEQVVLFGWEPAAATPHERQVIARAGLRTFEVRGVRAQPQATAWQARRWLEERHERFLVHFDVDVIDFSDVPLSENTGRGEGLSYRTAIEALGVLLASPRLAAVAVTELNPDHVEAGAGTLERFARDLARCLAGGAQRRPAARARPPVRRAGPDDADAAGRLLHDFQVEYEDFTPGPEALADRLRELLQGEETAVLLAGDPPHGLAVLRFRPSLFRDGPECYVAELYVAPEHRGEGDGRALMESAMDLARARGARYIELGTEEDDVAARALYESLGFTNTRGSPGGAVSYFYERDL